jgi:hypothetical protein
VENAGLEGDELVADTLFDENAACMLRHNGFLVLGYGKNISEMTLEGTSG